MNKRIKDISAVGIGLLVVIAINFIAHYAFFRVDLTEDQRYSVSENSVNLLEGLEEKVYVKVYLHGDFPARFKNLEISIREKLDELKVYGGSNLKYQFIDPSAISDKKERTDFYYELARKGIQPTTLHDNENGKKIEKLIFPGAIISYGSRETSINFLQGNKMASPEIRINNAIEGLEYEFTSAIQRVKQTTKKKVAFIDGHGELSDLELQDIMNQLSASFMVGRLNIATVDVIEGIDALVIAKPKTEFSEEEKFKLDQFVMNGGKVLFFIDALEARRDSTSLQALPYKHNLDDLIFKYGARFNKNIIQDLYAAPVPVNTGTELKLMPWTFFPLLNKFSDHVIVKNMDAIVGRYLGSVDTVKAPGIKKTPLVFTSQYTKVKGQPVVYSADELRIDLDKKYYNQGSLPISYLLEGKFQSLYIGRPTPKGVKTNERKTESVGSKILVFSDGDILANEIDPKSGKAFQLGFDKYTKQVYSNADFVRNAINYMLDEQGTVKLRNKTVQLRPLDKLKVKEETTKWKVINLVVPILILILFGIIRQIIRKRKYTKF